MKNGYVLVDHHGDHGTVRVGMIRRDLSNEKFGQLEKRGLIREATASELERKRKRAPENKSAPTPENKGS